MKLKTIIIEDQAPNRETLELVLANECPQVEVIGYAESVSAGYELIKNNEVDLVFFDIDILEGTSFDILIKLQQEDAINFKFIFLTGHTSSEYTLKALKYAATDYLIKPLIVNELILAIEKIEKETNNTLNLLLNLLANPFNLNHEIAISSLKGVLEVCRVGDIRYFESYNSITRFHLKENREIIGNKNIGYYDRNLSNDFAFMKIDQGIVINLAELLNYKHAELLIKLKDGTELRASREGGKALKRYLLNNNRSALKSNILKDFLRKLW